LNCPSQSAGTTAVASVIPVTPAGKFTEYWATEPGVPTNGASPSVPLLKNTCTLGGASASEMSVMTKNTPVWTVPPPWQPASVMVDGFT
jgi:hypothetical protein